MRIPKRYGESRVDRCPFCERMATTKNPQDIPVCESHKKRNLTDLRCACGEYLDPASGKWGPYFRCLNCGNISFSKGLEMNERALKREEASTDNRKAPQSEPTRGQHRKEERKEIVIRSDDPDYFY